MTRVSAVDRSRSRIATPSAIAPNPGTAQATLLNIMGDIVHPSTQPVPTAAFLDVMGGLGYSEPAIRQGVARCSGAGWIGKERKGRSTLWRLTTAGVSLVEEGLRGVGLLADGYEHWDGRWRVLTITIPTEQRAVRDRVYRDLRWDGFGNPMPSVWISPHPERYGRTRRAIAALDLGPSTLSFVGQADNIDLPLEELTRRAWDLDALQHLYAELVQRFYGARPHTDEDHLLELLRLDQELQQLLVTDPLIPSSLTPGWSGRHSAARLLDLRATWRPNAQRHWSTVLARCT